MANVARMHNRRIGINRRKIMGLKKKRPLCSLLDYKATLKVSTLPPSRDRNRHIRAIARSS